HSAPDVHLSRPSSPTRRSSDLFKKGPRAVDGIDLQVAPGEIYGFLGPNGAGKSTTVLMLTTLLPPTAGTARVAGWDVSRDGARVDRKSTRLNSSHVKISYAVFC